jgi:hypothetical protein
MSCLLTIFKLYRDARRQLHQLTVSSTGQTGLSKSVSYIITAQPGSARVFQAGVERIPAINSLPSGDITR